MNKAWAAAVSLVLGAAVARGAQVKANVEAIWEPPDGAVEQAKAELAHAADMKTALVAAMQKSKASKAAVAFATRVGPDGGYMQDAMVRGPILVGTLCFPLRTNGQTEPFVSDAQHRLLRPAVEKLTDAELRALPAFASRKDAASLIPWAPELPPAESASPDGGIVLTFGYPLRTCHACPPELIARVAYEFRADGRYRGRKVTAVAPPHPELVTLLEKIYASYAGPGAKGVDLTEDGAFGRFFDASLTKLYERDREESKGEVGRLDGDPFLGAQDWDVRAVTVDVDAVQEPQAHARVALQDVGKTRLIDLRLVKEAAGWRISDVRWPGQKQSLRELLSAPAK